MGFNERQIALLEEQIDPSNVSERQGAGRMTLSYVEGFYSIQKANEIFGYDGWSYEVVKLDTYVYPHSDVDHPLAAGESVQVRATAQVKVTINPTNTTETVVDGLAVGSLLSENVITRMDVGHGSSKSTGIPDFESAEKEAVTDALKRALRTFGNQFGNSLYDKKVLAALKGGGSAPRPAVERTNASATVPASEKQIGFVKKLLTEKERSLSEFTDKAINALTKADASRVIEALQK